VNPEEYVDFLIVNGRKWIESQRAMHRPNSMVLPESARLEFAPFFESETIDRVRIKIVPVIENPDFYTTLTSRGISIPLDFSNMSGITFVDTILFSQKLIPAGWPSLPLLFHELVHVVQYEVLGLETFTQRYVRGWFENEQDYRSIPLERDANGLQRRYEENLKQGFSVIEEVRLRLGSL
jgi:hypothetical protein